MIWELLQPWIPCLLNILLSDVNLENPVIKEVGINLFKVEAQIDLIIRISENYVWLSFYIVPSKKLLQKFWPKNWWEENYFRKSELKLLIDGNFIMASPLSNNVLSDMDGHHKLFDIKDMPYSVKINECTSNHSFFRFRFKLYHGARNFIIKLLNGVEEENPYIGTIVYSLVVDDNLKNVAIKTKNCTTCCETIFDREGCGCQNFTSDIFANGKLFEVSLNITGDINKSKFYLSVNGRCLKNFTVTTNFHIWKINKLLVSSKFYKNHFNIKARITVSNFKN
uniref:Uncharacterized protein n=1 Tax=Meloidogyne enterolobii TaxID=390850 RepID=A0A6V7VHM2_MELEN|nr:unnamed protein product [Meloidogyne enterolobii]